jgi:hypothetical protein
LGNFPNLGKFDSRLGIEIHDWEIPKNLKTWGNSATAWESGDFLRFNLKIIPLLQFFGMTFLS